MPGPRQDLTKEYLYQEYIIKERTIADIAREKGAIHITIVKYLRKHGIPIRETRLDLTGKRFTRLVVQDISHKGKNDITIWNCVCDCGKICKIPAGRLTSGKTRSCGCIRFGAKRKSKPKPCPYKVGDKISKWEIVSEPMIKKFHKCNIYWLRCRCECGTEKELPVMRLKSGRTNSCGCGDERLWQDWEIEYVNNNYESLLCKEMAAHLGRTTSSVQHFTERNGWTTIEKHGYARIPEYKIWAGIKQRCYNQNTPAYPDYGGRGILMDEDFKNSFVSFYEYIGPRPSKRHSVDRIDNYKGYVRGNIRWATYKEQAANKRTKGPRQLTLNGKTQTVQEWSLEVGLTVSAIDARLRRGWPVEQTLTLPKGCKDHDIKLDDEYRRKALARGAVGTAVRKGILIKPEKCEKDGCEEAKVEAHHYNGYEQKYWLDVKWLCKNHHACCPKPKVDSDTSYTVQKELKSYTWNGETHNLPGWSKILGISENCLRTRLKMGWAVEKALTTPPQKKTKKD